MDLSEEKLDALREIAHVGAGNASKSLSELTDEKVEVTFPNIRSHRIKDVPDLLGGYSQPVTVVAIKVSVKNHEGDDETKLGHLLLSLDWESAKQLAEDLTSQEVEGEELSEMQRSSLSETGNILAGSCLAAITEYVDLKLVEGVPQQGTDLLGAIMDEYLLEVAEEEDEVLVFETNFSLQKETKAFFMLIFEPGKYDLILDRIEVDQ
ncbi:MAG: chemotaxis protein CheC [Candidatus Nanohaloarchaea archaeon]